MKLRKENRLTIVNEYGRELEYWDVQIVESIQDEGRTLKLFIKKKPKCSICGKPMKNAMDSITKEISQYLWETNCDCKGFENMRLSIG